MISQDIDVEDLFEVGNEVVGIKLPQFFHRDELHKFLLAVGGEKAAQDSILLARPVDLEDWDELLGPIYAKLFTEGRLLRFSQVVAEISMQWATTGLALLLVNFLRYRRIQVSLLIFIVSIAAFGTLSKDSTLLDAADCCTRFRLPSNDKITDAR